MDQRMIRKQISFVGGGDVFDVFFECLASSVRPFETSTAVIWQLLTVDIWIDSNSGKDIKVIIDISRNSKSFIHVKCFEFNFWNITSYTFQYLSNRKFQR